MAYIVMAIERRNLEGGIAFDVCMDMCIDMQTGVWTRMWTCSMHVDRHIGRHVDACVGTHGHAWGRPGGAGMAG